MPVASRETSCGSRSRRTGDTAWRGVVPDSRAAHQQESRWSYGPLHPQPPHDASTPADTGLRVPPRSADVGLGLALPAPCASADVDLGSTNGASVCGPHGSRGRLPARTPRSCGRGRFSLGRCRPTRTPCASADVGLGTTNGATVCGPHGSRGRLPARSLRPCGRGRFSLGRCRATRALRAGGCRSGFDHRGKRDIIGVTGT